MPMPPKVRRAVTDKVARILVDETVISYLGDEDDPLALYLQEKFPTLSEDLGLPAPAIASLLVFEAADGQDTAVDPNAKRPFAAARYLLALAAPYSDVSTVLPEVGFSIAGLPGNRTRKGLDPVQFHGLRRELAAKAGRFGKVADGTIFNKVESTRRIAQVLLPSVDQLVDSQDWDAIKRRQVTTAHTRAEYNRWLNQVSRGSMSDSVRDALAVELDRPPPHYPRHLSLSGLAENLVFRRVSRPGVQFGAMPHESTFVSERTRRLVVLGKPGVGKTSFVRARLASHLRRGGLGAFVYLPDLAKVLSAPTPVDLYDAIEASELRPQTAPAKRVNSVPLARRIENRDFAVVLDGLDEVPDDQHTVIVEALEKLDREVEGAVWTTSRFSGYLPPYPAQAIEIEGIDAPATFFRAWWPDGSDELLELERRLKHSADLTEIAKVPVVAGLMASTSGLGQGEALTKGDIYRRYVDMVLTRAWKQAKRRHPVRIEVIREAAEALAWAMATTSAPFQRSSQWVSGITLRDAVDVLGHQRESDLIAIAHDDGLLSPRRPPRGQMDLEYGWMHRSVHEYMVGQHLLRSFKRDSFIGLRLTEEALLSSQEWAEAVSFMIDEIDPDQRTRVIELMDRLTMAFPDAIQFKLKLNRMSHGRAFSDLRSRGALSTQDIQRVARAIRTPVESQGRDRISSDVDTDEAERRFSTYPGTRFAVADEHLALLRSIHACSNSADSTQLALLFQLWRRLLVLDTAPDHVGDELLELIEIGATRCSDRMHSLGLWREVLSASYPLRNEVGAIEYLTKSAAPRMSIIDLFHLEGFGARADFHLVVGVLNEENCIVPETIVAGRNPNELMRYLVESEKVKSLSASAIGNLVDLVAAAGTLAHWRSVLELSN